MRSWPGGSSVPEDLLSAYLRDLGVSLIDLGWSPGEVNQATFYVRRAHERGGNLGNACAEVFQMKKEGKLTPDEPL